MTNTIHVQNRGQANFLNQIQEASADMYAALYLLRANAQTFMEQMENGLTPTATWVTQQHEKLATATTKRETLIEAYRYMVETDEQMQWLITACAVNAPTRVYFSAARQVRESAKAV
jgi:hypothetical protein